jgi:hypothetical protein
MREFELEPVMFGNEGMSGKERMDSNDRMSNDFVRYTATSSRRSMHLMNPAQPVR